MTGWQWFHMFDTSMFFHHMWSWLTHPLHHRPSWPSWHFVNLTGGWLSVTLSTTSWHKVHHRIEEHQRKMNLNPPHLPQRLFFPSCWRNPRPRSPATPTKQWTPWMDALISPTRTFESIFPVEKCPYFWGFSHVFKCRYKWNLWRQKGFWWNVIWIFSCERWGWLVPSKTKMWKLGSVSPCTWQLQLIFHWKGSGRYTRESPHHAELFEWLLQRGEVANSGAFCGHEVGKVWEREEMPTDFWVWKQFLP